MASHKPTYAEMLRDPRWQRRRLEILSRDEFTCQRCRSTTKELHAHHKFYLSGGKSPWEYGDEHLITLCLDCHEHATKSMALLRAGLAQLDPHMHEIVRGYVDALACIQNGGPKIEVSLSCPGGYVAGVAHSMGMDEYDLLTVLQGAHPSSESISLGGNDLFLIYRAAQERRGR